MDTSDLTSAIFAGNDMAMQWWALTHQTALPSPGTVVLQPTSRGGSSLQIGSGALLLIALVVIGGVILLKD